MDVEVGVVDFLLDCAIDLHFIDIFFNDMVNLDDRGRREDPNGFDVSRRVNDVILVRATAVITIFIAMHVVKVRLFVIEASKAIVTFLNLMTC